MTPLFDSRLDAGRRLAAALAAYRGRHPLVLALPRGAVAMGAEIARLLEGELDVVLVKKLRAVPVAPPESLELIRPYADELVCLETPEEFMAVGQFYRHFDQVADHEVVALLARHGRDKAPA